MAHAVADSPRFGSMKALRPEEEWARDIISQTLSVPVEQNDDNSQDGMHDLWILHPDRPAAAVEVTAAADSESIELSKLINAKERWIVPGLRGGWAVSVDPSTARAKLLFAKLPAFLSELEGAGETDVDVDPATGAGGRWDARAHELGVTRLFQSAGTDYPGSVYVLLDEPLERRAGYVAPTGDAIAEWIGGYLQSERASDLAKLARSRAPERHAFVLVPMFTTAPFAVSELLMTGRPRLPITPPRLPVEVSHVWIVGMAYDRAGFYWAPDAGWSSVRTPSAPLPGSDG
jgi:hypothetical protein